MEIISHRGYWQDLRERNTKVAFERSFDLGFGTETDVRDLGGELVISHDMPQGNGAEMTLDDLLTIMAGRNLPLAINVKADGLAQAIAKKFAEHDHNNWFAFDMSVPDMRSYLSAGVPAYTRQSEFEVFPCFLNESAGVWLDSFGPEWYCRDDIEVLLNLDKRVCVVSSELHKREHMPLWEMLLESKGASNLMLCTDIPEHASKFFL